MFGPAAKARGRPRGLVPARDDAVAPRCAAPIRGDAADHRAGALRAGRLLWAELLRRVFADPTLVRTLLAAIGLTHEPATDR